MVGFKTVEELIAAVNAEDAEVTLEFPDVIKYNSSENREQIQKLADFLKNNTSIKTIYLNGCNIGDEGAKVMAHVLKNNANIKSLGLADCGIGDDGAKALADALKTNTSIEWLCLRKNNLGNEGNKALAEALKINKTASRVEFDLENMNAYGFTAILDALKINTTIKGLGHPMTLVLQNAKEDLKEIVQEINDNIKRNKSIEDALSDYAKTILGAKLVQAINRDEQISERDKNKFKLQGDLEQRQTGDYLEELEAQARKILFKGMTTAEIINFSDAWHSALQQQKSLAPKDFNGIEWPSLFGSKEIDIPADVMGEAGYKLVARTSPVELKEEGKKLDHCVGGYSNKCILGNTHIISVVNPQGEPISTIEYESENKKISCEQHHGKKNVDPSKESIAAQKWFEREVKSKRIKIDYDGLEEALEQRKKTSKTLESRATLVLGFNSLDKDKCREVIAAYKDMADTTARGVKASGENPAIEPVEKFWENFKALLNLKEITLNRLIGGKTTFSLEEKKVEQKKEKVSDVDVDKEVKESLKKSVNKLFGEGTVDVSIIASKDNNGHVLLKTQDGSDLSHRLNATSALKGKFEKTEAGFESKLAPLPTSKLLEGVAFPKDKSPRDKSPRDEAANLGRGQ